MAHDTRMLAALSLACSLGACAQIDPLTAAGRWSPNGANDANLAAEIANPNDLFTGQAIRGADGLQAAAAVERLRQDHLRPLPDTTGTGSGSATTTQAGGTTGTGGGS